MRISPYQPPESAMGAHYYLPIHEKKQGDYHGGGNTVPTAAPKSQRVKELSASKWMPPTSKVQGGSSDNGMEGGLGGEGKRQEVNAKRGKGKDGAKKSRLQQTYMA